jgi:hypothetical protein
MDVPARPSAKRRPLEKILKTLHLWEFVFRLRKFICQFLRVDAVRSWVAAVRYVYFAVLLRRMKTLEPATGDVTTNTVFHNMKNLSTFYELAVARSNLLLLPLSAIRLSKSTPVLCIGPRTEGEMLNLMGLGFHNFRALDLISYSPWVDLGDMHAMPYKDNQFGIVIMGWVIAYSNNRKKAAAEAIRVVRDGGFIAVGAEYVKKSAEECSAMLGYPLPITPIQSVSEILEYFGSSVDHVVFSQDRPPYPSEKCDLMVIFSVKKSNEAAEHSCEPPGEACVQ